MQKYFAAWFGLMIGSFLWGQGSAQMNGTVRDQSGSAVPGAVIKITQTATGAVRTANSSDDGQYSFTALPLGPYLVEVTKEGFSKYVQSGVVLQVNSNPTVDASLKVGSVSDQVVVEASAALIETQSTGVGTVLDNQRVLEMPLNGRQVTELIFLAGAANAVPLVAQGSVNSVRNYPTVVISVSGGINNGITYTLDGANHNDSYNNLNLPLPFPDALQEFKVETSALSAQYGLHSAGAVNVVTKSGTNQIHGDAFEFLRNGDLNARQAIPSTTPRDNLRRNQFGGVIGGPIKKDQLFFFAGYQGTTVRSAPPSSQAFVPTAKMQAGDFTDYASAACNLGTAKTLTGYPTNIIPKTDLNPAALIISSKLPVTTDPCGKVFYGLKNNSNESQGLLRFDYQKSAKHNLFGRYFIANLDQPSTYDGVNPLTFTTLAAHFRVHTLSIGDTYLFGSGMVSSFRIGATRSESPKIPVPFDTWKSLGVNAVSIGAPLIRLNVSSGFAIGGGNTIISEPIAGPDVNIAEDLSMVRGNHQIQVGGSWIRTSMSNKSGLQATGAISINATGGTGLALSNFMVGRVASWTQGNLQQYYLRNEYYALYAQDNWKISRRLTLNYGVRWEPYLPITSKYPTLFAHFDQSRFDQGLKSSVFVNAPAGVTFPGDPTYTAGNAPHDRNLNKFVPRIGLVWDPKGDGKMIVRASYGMLTDRFNFNSYTAFSQDPPTGNTITNTGQPASAGQPAIPVNLSDPWATYPGGVSPLPTLPSKNMVFNQFTSWVTHPFDYKQLYLNQWNLSIQRQLGKDWLLTATYLGNNTIHLTTETQLNPAVYVPGFCPLGSTTACSTTTNTNQRRRLFLQNPTEGKYFAYVNQLSDGGTGSYNSLYLAAQKRLSTGVSVLANYTWSHCISDLWNGWVGNNASSSVSIGPRSMDRGNCLTSDSRQVFNLSVVAQTPKFSNRLVRMVAGDWQISPIVRLRSSDFVTVHSGTVGISGQGGNSTLPGEHVLLKDPNGIYPANQTASNWLNPAAFALPTTPAGAAAPVIGNLGLFNIKGPGTVTMDVGVSRTFTLMEGKTLQLRGEAFNLPNFVNLGSPVASLNSNGTFGTILTSKDPRIVQVAMKFAF
jgi:hypothetical protein